MNLLVHNKAAHPSTKGLLMYEDDAFGRTHTPSVSD